MIYDRFTCPDAPLTPPEDGIDLEHLPRCPVCGEVCETIYLNCYNEPVGCDGCLTQVEAREYDDG